MQPADWGQEWEHDRSRNGELGSFRWKYSPQRLPWKKSTFLYEVCQYGGFHRWSTTTTNRVWIPIVDPWTSETDASWKVGKIKDKEAWENYQRRCKTFSKETFLQVREVVIQLSKVGRKVYNIFVRIQATIISDQFHSFAGKTGILEKIET